MLAAAVLVTGGMSLHSYLSEQRAKNEYDAIRQEVVAEPAAGETQEEIAGEKLSGAADRLLPNLSDQPGFSWMALFPGIGHQLSGGTGEDNDYYLKHSFEGRV